MSAHSRPHRSRSRSSVRDSRDRRRRDSRPHRSRSPVRDSQPAHSKLISAPNVIAIVVLLARDTEWIDTLNVVLRELKDMELDRKEILWRDLLEAFLTLANQLVYHSFDVARLASSIQSLSHNHINSFISLLDKAKQQSSGKKGIIYILLRSFGKSACNVGMADTYNRQFCFKAQKLYTCKCENGRLVNMDYIGIKVSGHCDLEKMVTGKSLCAKKCRPGGLSYRYHSAPTTLYIRIYNESSLEMTINGTITISDVNGIKHKYKLDTLSYHDSRFGHLVTAIYQNSQLFQLDTSGTYQPVPGDLLNRDVCTGIHYVRYKRAEHDNNNTSSSISYSGLTSNVSPADNMSTPNSQATETATQHSTNSHGSKSRPVPYNAEIPSHSLPPPAIIPSVSSDQQERQQKEQSNGTPIASTQAVPAKRNHNNAFDDAPLSPPYPPSAAEAAAAAQATSAASVSITATSVDSNLDMDELDCMFGHGWRYTRSVPPPSTSSTDTPNDHIGIDSVKKKRKIVDAASSSDPSAVNIATAAAASLQTESSVPLLLGESFTTLDGGSISFDELSLELQSYLEKHTDLTMEHQQCIVNTWLLIDKRQKEEISSDAANLLPQQQQQRQQRIRAAAASSKSSNKECIIFDQPVPTANSDTVIVDEPGLKVCTLNLRHVNGITFIPFINHYLNKYPIIAFTEFSSEMMDGIKMHCKSMASFGNSNNRYEIYGHGRVAMLVNCASIKSVIDVELEQYFAGFCSSMPLAADTDIAAHKGDFANRFAVYNVKMSNGTMQSIAIAYFHSDWSKNASIRILFGKYIEYCLTRIELHPSRMVVGDFNSVGSWMDRARNARLPTAKIEDRDSEEYQCWLKKYREECHHHRESVLLPLSRAGFIDGIHLARCIQGESVDISNISFRFSYYYQLHPVSALDLVFLPPHLLSGAVIQYGPDGGIIPFLDHSAVSLHLPSPATSVDDTLGAIDIPSCYLEALPIPTILADIHAPADFYTVTNTFRFDINGSNLGGISMHASISRSSIQHIHPPQSVASYLFLKGITRRSNDVVRSSSSNSSSSSSSSSQLQQQSQHGVSSSSSSSSTTTIITSPPPQLQRQDVSVTKKRDRKKLDAYSKKHEGNLKTLINTLRGLVGASPSLSQPKVVQKALQTISPNAIPISTWDYRGIIKQFRDVIPNTQSLSKPKLLEAAIEYIESHNLQATISTSEQEQQVHQQQQQQQRQRQAARAASSATVSNVAIVSKPRRPGRPRKSEQQQQHQQQVQQVQQQIVDTSNCGNDYHIDSSFHINQQQLSHSCSHQEQTTTSSPVSTSTAAATLTPVSQWQQHQHQHQQQQPHPFEPSVSIVTSLPLEGSDIAKPSVPHLPPSDFSISPASSTQQQKQSPPSATVLNEVKSSQPRRQYQPRKNTYTSSYGSSLSELQQQPFIQHSGRPILTRSTQQPQRKYYAEQKELYSQLYDILDGTRLFSRHALINTATDFIAEKKRISVPASTVTPYLTDGQKLKAAIDRIRHLDPSWSSLTQNQVLREAINVIESLKRESSLTT